MKKLLIVLTCMAMVFGSSTFAFATDINGSENEEENIRESIRERLKEDIEKKGKKIIEKTIFGQITEIDAEKVVVNVAVRNKVPKKNENKENNSENKIDRETREKFVLTGENKAINITNADLGKRSELTYEDYKVGDYVRITLSKDNENAAKRMRLANAGADKNKTGNYQGGYKGKANGEKKGKKDKNGKKENTTNNDV